MAASIALLVSGLAAAPAAQAADPPPPPAPFAGDQLEVADLPTYPALLVTDQGRAHYLAQSAEGTAVQEYGASGTPTPEVQKAWADAEAYPHPGVPARVFREISAAIDVATGDVDGDGSIDSVYLVPPTQGATTAGLVVLGGQQDGFPVLATRADVAAGASRVEVVLRTNARFGQDPIPTIVVATGSPAFQFYSYKQPDELEQLTATVPVGFDTRYADVLDTTYRAPWDAYASESRIRPVDQFAAVSWSADDRELQVSRFRLSGEVGTPSAPGTPSVPGTVFVDVVDQDKVADAPQPVNDARIASDYDPDQRDSSNRQFTGEEIAVSAVLPPQAPGLPSQRSVWRVPYTAPSGGPSLGTIAVDLDICPQQPETDGPVEAPSVDVEVLSGAAAVQCTEVVDGTPDRLQVGTWVEGITTGTSEIVAVPGQTSLSQPTARIVLPCLWLLEGLDGLPSAPGDPQRRQVSCSTSGPLNAPFSSADIRAGFPFGPGTYSRVTDAVVLRGDGGVPLYVTRTNNVAGVAVAVPAPLTTVTPATASGAPTSGPLLVARLPHQRNTVTLSVPSANRDVVQTKAVPVAFLAAPPQVAGAGQAGDAPVFASSASSGTSTTTSTSTTIGATIGVSWEDPTGAFGIEASASIDREAENGYTASRTITTSQSYTGLSDDDAVVYRTSRFERFKGSVVASSTGVALGTTTTIDLPMRSVQSVASLEYMRKNFPEQFGPGGTLEPAMQQVFGHTVGNPGSYLRYGSDGREISGYCDGSLDPGGDRELKAFDPLVPANPFTAPRPADPPQPDILVSDLHQVLVGTGTAEGASFAIEDGQENSRVTSTTATVDAAFTAGYLTAGVTAGFTWSKGWSQSLSKGVEFSSGVGLIPGTGPFLKSETYDWRSFLCQKTITGTDGVPLTAWVLNYTVDKYAGSGGLQPLSPVTVESPKDSATATGLRPDLTWSQDTGTVQSYDWRIEAVGANDVVTGSVQFTDPIDSKNRRTVVTTATPSTDLLPNQLYRWRVTATDFFGNSAQSDYEFFVTPGTPTASFDASTLTPSVGQKVSFSDTSVGGPTSWSWDFGDGTTSTLRNPQHTFTATGDYDVTLTVESSFGTSTTTRTLSVGAGAEDDAYTTDEDTPLVVAAASGVLANDPSATAASLLTAPSHGGVTLASSGAFTYTPSADWCGTDAFSYTASPGSRTATATVVVACVADPPKVDASLWSTAEDTTLTAAAPGLLATATDAEGDGLTASLASPPDHGSVTVLPDGSFTYVPDADWCGTDTFGVRVTGGGQSTVGTASVAVGCRPDAPVGLADSATLLEDTTLAIDVLRNDRDVDGEPLTVDVVTDPGRGTATVSSGKVVYKPRLNQCGRDSFRYQATDPTGRFAEVAVSVNVVCVNDAPIAKADSYKRGASKLTVGSVLGALANDSDAERTTLRAVLYRAPLYGKVSLSSNGSFVYTPAPGRSTDYFVYRAYDGQKYSVPVRVTITRR